jgi:ABC-type transport system substrate-binding protein
MPSARTWIICTCALSLAACDAPAEPAKVEPLKAEPAKVEPLKAEPAKVEPLTPEQIEPPSPTPATAEPLSFTFGTRTLTAANALSSRFNDQRRIIISSQPLTCEELLAIPEQYKKGKVSFIVTTAWTVGTHALTSAEILDDDTRKVTNIYPESGTIEILAAPPNAGDRGRIKLSVSAADGGAKGEIDVELCE